MNNENDSNDTILSSTNNNVENDFNFSEDYIDKTKRDLALKILNLVGINGFDDKKYILYETLLQPELFSLGGKCGTHGAGKKAFFFK